MPIAKSSSYSSSKSLFRSANGQVHVFLKRAAALSLLTLALAGCNAVPKVDVTPQGATVTTESGGSVALSIVLAKRPLAPVDVYAVSSDASEASVSAGIHFDQNTWQIPQIIRVTGLDDTLSDGDVAYDVAVYARSARAGLGQPELVTTVHFINHDNDVALFQGLGDLPGGADTSHVAAISASGDVVVGWSGAADGDQGMRWTPTAGLQALLGPTSHATAISPNGMLIAGSYSPGGSAVLWTDNQPLLVLVQPSLGPPANPGSDGPLMKLFDDATVVRDDGRVYGSCFQYDPLHPPSSNRSIACYYDGALPLVGVFGTSYIYAADSADNYAGSAFGDPHQGSYSNAVYDGQQAGWPSDVMCAPPLGCTAEARSFSANGALVVGTSAVPALGDPVGQHGLVTTAFAYTPADGTTVRLPDLQGGDEAAGAYAVSADGRLIAGFGTDERGMQAVVWTSRAPRALEDVLLEQGAAIPDGWTLQDVRAVSADGHVLAGNGLNPHGNPEGFRVVLPNGL